MALTITPRQLAIGLLIAVALWPSSSSASATPRLSRADLERLAGRAESIAKIDGFKDFATLVAFNESRFNNLAINEDDAKAAKAGWENKPQRFGQNPHPKATIYAGSRGWFQFLPSTALSAPGFHNADPLLLHNGPASVALFADYVRRMRPFLAELPEDERHWLALRRSMASLATMYDWREETINKKGKIRSKQVREKMARQLGELGLPVELMYEPVSVGDWPDGGALALWGAIGGAAS